MRFIIYCSRCERTIRVAGRIWTHRLRYSTQDDKGRYLGWNCDRCADHIECGADY